uniref:Uncharacterized protein n=1 Tax=Acrobeloides nanus TaxID=290746 RepID=A0A914DZ62_9BILA
METSFNGHFVHENTLCNEDTSSNGLIYWTKCPHFNSWDKEVEKIHEIIEKIDDDLDLGHDGDAQEFLQIVKPWDKEIKRIHEIIKKIDEDVQAFAPLNRSKNRDGDRVGHHEDQIQEYGDDLKAWLDDLVDEMQRTNEKLQEIRQNYQEEIQGHELGKVGNNQVNIAIEREELKNNVKPWLDKLQKIQEHLRELRQNGQPEESEAGRPRHHLIGRRPPAGRILAPRVPRAAAMHRTKHPMPFSDIMANKYGLRHRLE